MKEHKLKKDRFVVSRGDNSHFINIYCSKCKEFIALYQKDGKGGLFRLYLDRIFEPEKLAAFQFQDWDTLKNTNIYCPKCRSLIGTPMIYEKEKRIAIRLQLGAIIKEKAL